MWVPIAVALGGFLAAPRILARKFAPPQRDASQTPADFGLPQESVWLESTSGKRLHAWFIPIDRRAPLVIVLHGWGGNAALMLPLAPHVHKAGYHALFLDARNHGLSEHDRFTSMPRFAEDLEVAAAWARSHPDVTSVGVIGHSVGAGAAIYSASRNDGLDAVVSVSAPAHPGDMMRGQMNRVPGPLRDFILWTIQRTIGHRFDDFAPRNRIVDVTVPIMLVHGAADQVVPVSNLYELSVANPKAEILVIAGAGHSDLKPFEAHVDEITEFLDRHLAVEYI